MKTLIILLVVLAAIWLWRNGRRKDLNVRPEFRERPPDSPAIPQAMVRCPVCGVHMPHADAIVGRLGAYCSDTHRQQAED